MSPGRWKPKRWPSPRKWPVVNGTTLQRSCEILKDLWPNGGKQRPAWAKLALERRWITWDMYFEVPMTEPGPCFEELVYKNSPMLFAVRRA